MPITPEQRREWGRKGGLKRAQQFTSASQRAARRQMSSETAAANGRKGAQVTIERHGMASLHKGARLKRLANPSPLELVMIGILSRLKVKYRREVVICHYRHLSVDFYIARHKIAIEVHGAIHDESKPGFKARLRRDREKRELLELRGRRLLIIHHSEFANVANIIERIKQEIGRDK